MTEMFEGQISDAEKDDIRRWIYKNQPKTQQNITIEGVEYILVVVLNEDGKIDGFKAKKPA
jgi:hypothetical protein